jgi:hypothetical protein
MFYGNTKKGCILHHQVTKKRRDFDDITARACRKGWLLNPDDTLSHEMRAHQAHWSQQGGGWRQDSVCHREDQGEPTQKKAKKSH